MNRDSVTDYLSYILFRVLGFFIRKLPLGIVFFLGRKLGDFIWFWDAKHRSIAYANMKTAFGKRLSEQELSSQVRSFYRSFGSTLVEFFLFPLVDKIYLDKYIVFEGLDNIRAAFKKGKGVILAVVHEGSWEISNIISANLGYPFSIVVRPQKKYKRLNGLLNYYRSQKGTRLIEAKGQTKKIIETLRRNEAIALTVDQGGKAGVLVKFFGKNASMSTGSVRLALKYGTVVLPVFSTRLNGVRIKVIIESPFEIKTTGDKEQDVRENLQRLVSIYERYISQYPKEYLWTYRIWKYTDEKEILILSDAKAGHLRQSQALAGIIANYFKENGTAVDVKTAEVKFRNPLCKKVLSFCALLGQRLLRNGLKLSLEGPAYESLIKAKPDIVISCGSSVAAVNFALSRQNLAKSLAIMRPGLLAAKDFDLLIMSRHDNPPKKKNIAVTAGALNLINEDCLNRQAQALREKVQIDKRFIVGFLVGGDTKDFRLKTDLMGRIIAQIKESLEKLDGQILITTSRRTSEEVSSLLRQEFSGYDRCRLLLVANERNLPDAVGGILGLSRLIITTPESISMISEAASSGKYVLVFDSIDIRGKHRRFLELFAANKYIYLSGANDLSSAIGNVWSGKPEIFSCKDNLLVKEAVRGIL